MITPNIYKDVTKHYSVFSNVSKHRFCLFPNVKRESNFE